MTLGLLLLPLSPARAGHWSAPTYSWNGTWAWSIYDSSGLDPIDDGGDGDNGWDWQDDFEMGNYLSFNPESLDIIINVTATLTWIHDDPLHPELDPPPASVCLIEAGQAGWKADCYGAHVEDAFPTGIADDGLGDTPAATSYLDGSFSGKGGLAQGYHAAQVDGSSGTITKTRTLEIGVSAIVPGDDDDCQAIDGSVLWHYNVFPVTLNLTGTTPDSDGSDNILIGQGCSGSLSATGPVTFSNYQWLLGPVFDQFEVAADQSWGHVDYLPDSAYHSPNPHWHYYEDSGDDTFIVTCSATASLNGVSVGTVQAQRDVKVWAPYYIFKNLTGPVSVDDRVSGLELYAGGPPVGGSGSGNWDPPGMKNGGRVGTPDLFRPAGVGLWQFVQFASPGRWYYSGTTSVDSFQYNGMYGLDNNYPYPGEPGDYAPPYPAWAADIPTTNPAVPTFWMEDSPGEVLQGQYSRVRVDESFDDYMMYQPPAKGFDSQWVPLHLFKWKWQADISDTGMGWASGWSPAIPGYVSSLSSARCTTFPSWQQTLVNQ